MFDYFTGLYNSFIAWIKGLFTDFTEFLFELPVRAFDGILSAVATIVEAIPAPDFVLDNSLQNALSSISPDILYFLSQSGLDNAMAVVSAGLAFRMLRKVVTLFQW